MKSFLKFIALFYFSSLPLGLLIALSVSGYKAWKEQDPFLAIAVGIFTLPIVATVLIVHKYRRIFNHENATN